MSDMMPATRRVARDRFLAVRRRDRRSLAAGIGVILVGLAGLGAAWLLAVAAVTPW